MHWKPLLALIIIIGITGFLLFSEKGVEFKENYLEKSAKTIGSFLQGVTGKFTQATIVNRTLVFKITTFQEDFKNIHLEIKEKPFIGVLKYDSVSVGGQNIRVRDNDEVNFYIENMKGEMDIDENGKMIISGYSISVELNDIVFEPEVGQERVEFELSGIPVSYSLTDIENYETVLTQVSGSLKLADWQPLKLEKDDLNIIYLQGKISLEDNSVTISGMAEKVRLNGVDLSLKK